MFEFSFISSRGMPEESPVQFPRPLDPVVACLGVKEPTAVSVRELRGSHTCLVDLRIYVPEFTSDSHPRNDGKMAILRLEAAEIRCPQHIGIKSQDFELPKLRTEAHPIVISGPNPGIPELPSQNPCLGFGV